MRINIQEFTNLLSQSAASSTVTAKSNFTAAVSAGGQHVSDLVTQGVKGTTGRLSHIVADVVSLGHTKSYLYILATDPMAV